MCGTDGGHGCCRERAEREIACLITEARPQGGWFPLHFAASNGYPAVIKKLLAAGAAKNVKNEVCVRGRAGVEGAHVPLRVIFVCVHTKIPT